MSRPIASNSKIKLQNDDHTPISHYWHLEFYERGIQQGSCRCGAVRFYPVIYTPEYLTRAEELNKKLGKTGNPEYHTEIKKEEIKTVNKEVTLPPIPPKPDYISPNGGRNGKLLHKYYMQNKDAIIADFNAIGVKAMREKWGISDSGWRTLRADLMPDKFPKPQWGRFKKEDAPKRSYHKKEKPVTDAPSRAEIECEETANARDRQLLIKNEMSASEERVIPRCRCPIVPIAGSKPATEPRPLTEDEKLYKQELLKETTPEQQKEQLRPLPAFPAFNDSWPERTQVTWLLVYQELTVCQKEKAASV